MVKVSVAMPIHNDAENLAFSLGSLIYQPIYELVIVLDRCTDQSPQIVHEFQNFVDYPVIVLYKTTKKWKHGLAEAFEKAFELCRGDIIQTMASDMICTSIIGWNRWPDIMSYRYIHTQNGHIGPHEAYLNLLNRLPFIYTCKYGKWSGHYAMKRHVWETLHYRDVRSPDLDFFNRAYKHGFSHLYCPITRHIHLRTGNTPKKQLDQGVHRAETHVSPLKVLAHSIIEVKPYVMAGYLKRRMRNKPKGTPF